MKHMDHIDLAEEFSRIWAADHPHGEVFDLGGQPTILTEVGELQLLSQVRIGPKGGVYEYLVLVDPSQPLYDQVVADYFGPDDYLIDLSGIRRAAGDKRELVNRALAELPQRVAADPARIISIAKSTVIHSTAPSSPTAGAPGLGKRR